MTTRIPISTLSYNFVSLTTVLKEHLHHVDIVPMEYVLFPHCKKENNERKENEKKNVSQAHCYSNLVGMLKSKNRVSGSFSVLFIFAYARMRTNTSYVYCLICLERQGEG